MADDDWKRQRDARLRNREGNRDGDKFPKDNCIHCGRPFYAHESSGGEYGICQDCIDG